MLLDEGYAVIPGPFGGADLNHAIAVYDHAIATARPEQVRRGSTSIRVNDLINCAPILAGIFTHEPLLKAASAIIGGPFKLSAFHSRSLRPAALAEPLHQDVALGQDGWPLVSFIYMIDAFEPANGATRFLPRSQSLHDISPAMHDCPDVRSACGAAGAMILFHGSTWHGHGTNATTAWRRSVQGALIPASATAARNHKDSLQRSVWSNLSPLARSVLSP